MHLSYLSTYELFDGSNETSSNIYRTMPEITMRTEQTNPTILRTYMYMLLFLSLKFMAKLAILAATRPNIALDAPIWEPLDLCRPSYRHPSRAAAWVRRIHLKIADVDHLKVTYIYTYLSFPLSPGLITSNGIPERAINAMLDHKCSSS